MTSFLLLCSAYALEFNSPRRKADVSDLTWLCFTHSLLSTWKFFPVAWEAQRDSGFCFYFSFRLSGIVNWQIPVLKPKDWKSYVEALMVNPKSIFFFWPSLIWILIVIFLQLNWGEIQCVGNEHLTQPTFTTFLFFITF